MRNVIERLNYPFYVNHSARFERELSEAIAKGPPPGRRTALFANFAPLLKVKPGCDLHSMQ